MQHLRLADDAQRNLLSLRNMREYKWVLIVTISNRLRLTHASSNREKDWLFRLAVSTLAMTAPFS